MEKLDTLHHLDLNQDEINLACSIINRFGCGQHPWADSENYHGFATSYLKELLEKVRSSNAIDNLTDNGKKILAALEQKL